MIHEHIIDIQMIVILVVTLSMGIPGSKNGGTLVPYFWPYFGGISPEI